VAAPHAPPLEQPDDEGAVVLIGYALVRPRRGGNRVISVFFTERALERSFLQRLGSTVLQGRPRPKLYVRWRERIFFLFACLSHLFTPCPNGHFVF
jgi:hypothetical protein